MTTSFDRVRSRTGSGGPGPTVDAQGKAALFSQSPVSPSWGRTMVVTCSACHGSTCVSYLHALTLALPSLHLLVLRRDYPSWMRCPSCGRRTWVSLRFC